MNPIPPLEYLLSCSTKSLQEMELNSLNRSQQCLRAAKEEWEEALAQRENAGLARWRVPAATSRARAIAVTSGV